MYKVSEEIFVELVHEAVTAIPAKYADYLENVSFMAAEAPTPQQGALLGLYEGIPLPARPGGGYTGVLPDVITIFQRPHEYMSHSLDELRREVRHTVWHEVAHYFGLDHDRIRALEE
jgi:predicted Zn-dependent protease with MMP-like domain